MKRILLTAAIVLMTTPALAVEKTQYVQDGVPAMKGMVVTPSANGQNNASGVVNGNDKMVKSYYNEKLKAEGWTSTDPRHEVYTRNGETLNLQTDFKNGQTTVNFYTTPAAPAPDAKTPDAATTAAPAAEQK